MVRHGRLLTLLVASVMAISLANPGVIDEGGPPSPEGLTPEAGVLEVIDLPARHSPGSPGTADLVETVEVEDVRFLEGPFEELLEPEPEPDPVPAVGEMLAIEVPVPPPEEPPEEPPEDTSKGIEVPMGTPPKVDVLFCLDTTGSMSDEIYVAKAAILDIAEVVTSGQPAPEVRYGLVIFRDLGDSYVTKVHDFMDVEELSSILYNVSARGGGDYEESVSEALHRSVHDVSWSTDYTSRAIYLIGDAPPHTDYDNGFDHLDAAMDAAERGIIINAIGCSGITGSEEEFRAVAELTGGTFLYLDYSGHGGGGGGWFTEDREGDVDTCCDGYGSGTGTGSGGDGSGGGLGSSGTNGTATEGSDGDYANDLDDVLTCLIQGQARSQGVEYEEDESDPEEG